MECQWQQRLTALVDLLNRYRPLWWDATFNSPDIDHIVDYPELAHWLGNLTEQQVEEFELNHASLARAASKYLPELNNLLGLTQFEQEEGTLPQPINPRQFAHIPGRKLAQIKSFVAALPPYQGEVLEWCAGKGHLGRLFSLQHTNEIISLEHDPSLCASGAALAERAGIGQQFVCQDALAPAAAKAVRQQQRAVALHACGDLHRQLLLHGVAHNTAQLAISPCCYHLTADTCYQPMSVAAKALPLPLERQHLRLAVLQTKTAPKRVRNLRAVEVSYRLGFKQLLQRLGKPERPLPSCGKQIFSQGFEAFCRWGCAQQQVTVSNSVDWDWLQRQGEQQWQRQRRLDLVRQLFRPAIESYLVLDRAIYLIENGYEVRVFRFCQDTVTPRNLLIFANRNP